MLLVRLFISFFLCVVCFSQVFAQSSKATSVAEQRERVALFMMRHLHYTLESWVSPTEDWETQAIWIYSTRNRIKALASAAHHYGVTDVEQAHTEILSLLDAYEKFVEDDLLYDFIADVAKPEAKAFSAIVAEGASSSLAGAKSGATVGGLVGTVTLPVVGTVAGAKVGAVGGGLLAGGATIYSGLTTHWEAVSANERIDAKLKEVRLKRIEKLRKQLDSTWFAFANEAKILSGTAKYDWGNETKLTDAGKTKIPVAIFGGEHNPFVLVQNAGSSRDVLKAASYFEQAAHLVPEDFDGSVDIFDELRANFLIASSRLFERHSRLNNSSSHAHLSIHCFEKAEDCLADSQTLSQPARLTFARALALAGRHRNARVVIEQVLSESPNSPSLLIDCALAYSVLGDEAELIEKVAKSFRIAPRWQPTLLDNQIFRSNKQSTRAKIREICAPPLIGTWGTESGYKLEFFYGGRVVQKHPGEDTKSGTYSASNGNLKLRTAADTWEFSYSINGDKLKLTGKKNFLFKRLPSRLIGKWAYDEETFEFLSNGRWRKELEGNIDRGEFALLISPSGKPQTIRCWKPSDPVYKPPREFAFQIDGEELQVTPKGSSLHFDYKKTN